MALILKTTGKSFIRTLRGKGQPGRIIGHGFHFKRGDTISTVLPDHTWAKRPGYIYSTEITAKDLKDAKRAGEGGVILQCVFVPGGAMKQERVPLEATPARSTNMAAFMKGFGCLKGKETFAGDAVEFQREMREEWR